MRKILYFFAMLIMVFANAQKIGETKTLSGLKFKEYFVGDVCGYTVFVDKQGKEVSISSCALKADKASKNLLDKIDIACEDKLNCIYKKHKYTIIMVFTDTIPVLNEFGEKIGTEKNWALKTITMVKQ